MDGPEHRCAVLCCAVLCCAVLCCAVRIYVAVNAISTQSIDRPHSEGGPEKKVQGRQRRPCPQGELMRRYFSICRALTVSAAQSRSSPTSTPAESTPSAAPPRPRRPAARRPPTSISARACARTGAASAPSPPRCCPRCRGCRCAAARAPDCR
jgi:hypothetical protein